METAVQIARWFAGGDRPYHTLWHCMNGDVLWITLTVALDLAVAVGYVIIAIHWSRNARFLPDSSAKRAMASIRQIFIFCGICGYLFVPIKLFWPAWRLYDIALAILVFYTWKYVWSSHNLKVVYNELGRTSKLVKELEASKADIARRSAFLNAVSHDLRTPLNGLTLRTSLAEIQLKNGDHPGLEKCLLEIRQSANVVGDMLNQLLDYARIDNDTAPPAQDAFYLRDLVDQVLRDTTPVAQAKGLTLTTGVSAGLHLVTDQMKLRRILGNLIGNAVKFTSPTAPGPHVRVEAEWHEHDLEIHVIDRGVGIPIEKQSAIFEEFYQVGNAQRDHSQGFGMGLPIARQLATKLGGEIQLHSSVGTGSRFTVVLPGVVWEKPETAASSLATVPAESPH